MQRPSAIPMLLGLAATLGLGWLLLGTAWNTGPEIAHQDPAAPSPGQRRSLEEARLDQSYELDERLGKGADFSRTGAEELEVGDRSPYTISGRLIVADAKELPSSSMPWVIAVEESTGREVIGDVAVGAGSYYIEGLSVGNWLLVASAVGYRLQETMISMSMDERALERGIVLFPEASTPVYVRIDGQDWNEYTLGSSNYPYCPGMARGLLRAILLDGTPAIHATPTEPRTTTEARHREVGVFKRARMTATKVDGALIGYLTGVVNGDTVALILHQSIIASQVCRGNEDAVIFALTEEAIWQWFGGIEALVVDGSTGQDLSGFSAGFGYGDHAVDIPMTSGPHVHLQCLPPGLIAFSLEKQGYVRYSTEATILPGRTIDFGRVELFPAAALSGRVLDDDGFPEPSALVEFWRVGTNVEGLQIEEFMAACDESGEFSMPAEFGATYLVRAHLSTKEGEWSSQVERVTVAKEAKALVLRLRRTRLVTVPFLPSFQLRQSDGTRIPHGRARNEAEAIMHFLLSPGVYSCSWRDALGNQVEDSMTIGSGSEPVQWPIEPRASDF